MNLDTQVVETESLVVEGAINEEVPETNQSNLKVATKPAASNLRTSLADQFPGETLEAALMDIEDIMARVQVPFFVLGEAARQMKDGEKLSGDGIDIGIRKNQLTEFVLSTLNTFQPELKLDGTEDGFTYLWQGVPIRIVYLDPEDELYKRADHVWYNSWEYMVPNPWKEYLKTL